MKRTLQKALSILLVLALLLPVAAMPAGAQDEVLEYNGWRYYPIFDGAKVAICDYVGDETELTVPAEIDGLPVWSVDGDETGFRDNDTVTKVVFPENVRVIQRAFNQYTALETVELPANVFDMRYSFGKCPNISEVFLPHGLRVFDTCFQTTVVGEDPKDLQVLYPLMKMYKTTRERLFSPKASSDIVEVIPYEYTIGDVNADNAVNTTDARMILQAAAGQLTFGEEQQTAADVDKNGEANTTDARRCLQYAAGMDGGFNDQLIHEQPLFSIDAATAVVTFKPVLSDAEPTVVEDANAIVRKALQAVADEDLSTMQVKMLATYAVDITWGEGTATEQVSLFIKKAGSEFRYGTQSYVSDKLGGFSWWQDTLT